MGLGRREARHQTVAAAHVAGVDPSKYWEYKPGQKVMTRDGYPGKVTAVFDGPFAGNEEYEVELDHGLGGGSYTASLLQPFHQVESKVDVKTAADDYPELGTILEERPPLARAVSSLQVEAKDTQADHDRDASACETCNGSGEIPDDDAGHDKYSDDPTYPNKDCPDCEGSGHKTAGKKKQKQEVADLYREDEHSCKECDSKSHKTGDCPDLHKEGAYNEGDPKKYTADHKCPECGGGRALESANGIIKCEDCGHIEDNGDEDGYGKTAAHILATAAVDSDFRFHVTATFADVRNKAKRLRSEGGVNIISASAGTIAGNIKGDHHVYETVLTRHPNQPNSVAQWGCGCKWAAYSWGRTGNYKRFEGRMCSHALALQYEAQSRGMFGRQVDEDQKAPQWLKPRTRVVVEYDRDSGKNQSRPAQPRKRDLERTYASVDASVAPVTLMCMLAAAQGSSFDDLSLALESAGINATAFLIESKDLPASDQDKSKHRHKGDQTPCSRAGCGHPDGIHGDNGKTCLSQGCDCRKFTTTATDDGQTQTDDEGSSKREGHKVHHPSHKGGEYPMRGGWGYGFGYQPYYADYDGGSSGPDGDGDADDAGGGSTAGDGGGMGSTGAKVAFYDTMDPTYTEGNDVRQNPNSNGLWNATKPANPNDNPCSVGWAAKGDPKEFGEAVNDAASRIGSLSVESVFDGLPPVEAWAPNGDVMDRPTVRTPPVPKTAPVPKTFNPKTPQAPKRTDLKTLRPPPGEPAGAAPEAPPRPQVPGPRQAPTAPRAPEAPHVPRPAGAGAAGEAATAGEVATTGEAAVGAGASGLVGPVVDSAIAGGYAGKWLDEHSKTYHNNVIMPIVNHIPDFSKPVQDYADSAVGDKIAEGADWTGHKVDQAAGAVGDAASSAWDWATGGSSKPKDAPKPAPAHVAPPTAPAKPVSPADFRKFEEDHPGPAVPMTPGHAAPNVPDPHEHGPGPQLQPGGSARQITPTAPAGPAAGTAPRSVPNPRTGPKDPQEPKQPEPKQDAPPEEGNPRPRLPKIPLPGIWHPDYYRMSGELIGGTGIGSKSSLDAGLTESRTAMAALLAEGTVHEEPEAALPTTDGADPTKDQDPDGDVEGMQSQGSLEEVDEAAVADIVARFQATAGASSLMSGSSALPEEGGDVAAMAKAYLQTEAMKTFSPGEQRQIIDEGKDVVASNLDRLKIEGTHYEALQAALDSEASQDDDGDLWS